jgi:XTP/dITP diphosphohydrolase
MMELIFATHNQHKTEEAKAILGNGFVIKNLKDLGVIDDIPETADTLSGNALLKAQYVFNNFHCNCFADDTGLEIEALDNRPGVYSARYAGENSTYRENVTKVLDEMKDISNRKACFKTVIALILDGKEYLFEGRVDGEIIIEPRGTSGFGYDPVFRPENSALTFAELGEVIKNQISHRGIVMRKLMDFLNNFNFTDK